MSTLRREYVFRLICAAMLLVTPLLAKAQVSTHIAYEDHIKNARKFSSLDENLLGDKVNLQDGAVSFAYDDISLSTNSGLKVMLGRKTPTRIQTNTPHFNVFGYNWDLNVPYMMGTYDSRDGWNAGEGVAGNGWGGTPANMNRCTSGVIRPRERLGPSPYYYTQPIYAHMYWKGVQINIPGYGQEQMLKVNAAQILPTNGVAYYATTKSLWKVSCLSSIKNDVGEGFKVTLPDGVTYHFDWMVKRKAVDLTDNGSTDSQGNGTEAWHLLAPLTDVYLYATKAVDRFGNTVTYTYDATYPNRITTIESNDGVRLDINYNTDGLISSVNTAGRTWVYTYSGRQLTSLQLPDSTKWTFSGDFASLSASPGLYGFWSNSCGQNQGAMNAAYPPEPNSLWTLTITHPSGARGDFTFRPLYHGMNNAPGGCGLFGSLETGWRYGTWGVPKAYGVFSLHAKKISGPGLSDRTWNYSYVPTWSFQTECNSGCASTTRTTVITNEGVTRRYIYGNDYYANHGQLLAETTEKNNVIVSSSTYNYVSTAADQPFPDDAGDIPKASGVVDLYGNPFRFKNRPLSAAVLQQSDTTFNRTIATFDVFARPSSVQKSSSLGPAKTEVIEYHDNLNAWVLGQVKRQSVLNAAPNGQATAASMATSETEYNAQALPSKTYKFGKLQQILSYWPDGNLNTISDGRGNTTWLGDYYRGIPRLIGHPATPEAPAGATESATVDSNGWITSVTDETGAKTCYGYDAMGRLSSIIYPSETQSGICDATRWFPTTQTFQKIDTPELGLATGHWRISRYEGNRHAHTYYDALWRPVMEYTYDTTDVGGTRRQTVTRYDSSGHLSFQSYPQAWITDAAAITQGTRTFYDALDRVVRVEQDSEHGVLATTTEYLAGLQTRVTNPKGQQTVTGYLAWDGPTYDYPIASVQPEGKVVEIARHPQFGWPLQLKQRNAANTISVTRQYVYDAHAQLCKTIEPETGATVTAYDEVGSPSWSATGLVGGGYDSAADCSYSAASASGRVVNRVYDNRNRLQHLYFPDGRGNQIWTYTPDSLPASITTYNNSANAAPVVNAYAYNARRMLAGESVSQPGWYTWSIGYGYDGLGNLATQTYPTGLIVDYAPNALGQATKAGNFASGAQYYPNGALKQFTYGNGLIYTMEQNARQLPLRTRSGTQAVGYEYWYDFNGNTTHIHDLVRGSSYSRLLQYDGLDRLTDAGSASFGGNHWHHLRYDALDNITSWTGVKDYAEYGYDAQNRLTNIRNSAGATVVGLSYDVQGNLSNKNGRLHSFDYGNRLREVMGLEYYRYDGHGRRVMTGRPTDFTLYQYSHTGQMLFEQPSASANKTHVYLAGSLVATHSSDGATVYSHTDALGSPVAVTNQAGQVIERHDYEPYGAIIGKPSHSGIGYTGHVMDGGTGLTYMQQRYYDHSVGRFLSVDPVTANGSTGANFNRYEYVGNNPYRYTDPDGRIKRPIVRWLVKKLSPESTPKASPKSPPSSAPKSQKQSSNPISGQNQGASPKINEGQQGKHQIGHNNYQQGRSILTEDPSQLGRQAGTGQQVGKIDVGLPGSKERVDFGRNIGTYVDPAGNSSPTTNGIIHYGKNGIHIVPSRPNP